MDLILLLVLLALLAVYLYVIPPILIIILSHVAAKIATMFRFHRAAVFISYWAVMVYLAHKVYFVFRLLNNGNPAWVSWTGFIWTLLAGWYIDWHGATWSGVGLSDLSHSILTRFNQAGNPETPQVRMGFRIAAGVLFFLSLLVVPTSIMLVIEEPKGFMGYCGFISGLLLAYFCGFACFKGYVPNWLGGKSKKN